MMDLKEKAADLINEFKPAALALKNKTTIVLATILITIIGISAYNEMPRENFPEIKIPTIFVGITYPGNSPKDMESLITRHVEKEIKTINGVTKISSTCIQDFSTTVVEFDFDVDPKDALQKVKDAVDKAKSELPTDMTIEPNIFDMDFSNIPVVNVNISGPDYNMDELKVYAEYLKDEIEVLSEVSKVEIKGALEKEVKVEINKYQMEAMDISFYNIEEAIKQENLTMSAGDLVGNQFRRTLRVEGQFKTIEDIENIIVKAQNGHIVFLKDIATITFGYVDADSYARKDGYPVISLDIMKRSGRNLIEAVDKVKAIIEKAKLDKIPKNVTITITNDTSLETKSSVADLENNVISAILLSVIILMLFLGFRNAMFVGVAIPLTMLMGFAVLHMMGYTLNMVLLFSLILALGTFIDNGIVVVENIYRHHTNENKPLMQAAIDGVSEVATPIFSSTLTNLASFLPMLFWPGIMGKFMKYLPITLIIILFSSLFVAFILVPVFTAMFMKIETGKDKVDAAKSKKIFAIEAIVAAIAHGVGFLWHVKAAHTIGNIAIWLIILGLLNIFLVSPLTNYILHSFLPRLEENYRKTLRFALRRNNPRWFVLGIILLFFFSIGFMAIRKPNVVFFPIADPNYVNVFIELPTGTDIEKTNRLAREAEMKIMAITKKYDIAMEAVLSNVGKGTVDPMGDKSASGVSTAPNKARLTVSFKEFSERGGIDTKEIMREIRQVVSGVPGANISVAQNQNGPPTGPPISINVSGDEFDKLIEIQNAIRQLLRQSGIQGIEELKSNLDASKPEMIINIDREAARTYGVSTGQIGSTIRTALFGKEITKYKQGEDDYPVMLRLDSTSRKSIDQLMNQVMVFRDQNTGKLVEVPIAAVAKVNYASSYGSITRKDQKRVVNLYSNVVQGYNADNINKEIEVLLKGLQIPKGYTISFGGEQEEQGKAMAFLTKALFIALFLILLILVMQFNSIIIPVIVMISALLSTIGVFLGLGISGMDFVVIMTMIGIISLAGVVVNNAIVLLDFFDLTKERMRLKLGIPEDEPLPKEELKEVIVESGYIRLRPVMLTALTAVIGLIPSAIGLNIDFGTLVSEFNPHFFIGGDSTAFWGPLSWAVMYGLTFATVITLVIVPVMTYFAERLSWKLRGK